MRVLVQTLIALAVILIIACQKPPEYPIEPVIEYKSIGKNILNQGSKNTDSTTITIAFTDGDGDLGKSGETSNNTSQDSLRDIFLIDSRDNFLLAGNTIPFIGKQGVGAGISGEITFTIYNACCIYEVKDLTCLPVSQTPFDHPFDTLTYDIYIRDRAGNFSNTVTTEPIYLRCD